MNAISAPFIAFVGTTPNIGTTATAFATAFRIAEASGRQVGYLCLHLKSAKLHRYLGIAEPAVTLDKLRPELASGSLTPDKLSRAVQTVRGMPNLHVLFGNMLRDQAEFFTPEEVEHLIRIAGQTFSIVVIDVGAYWDNAATICALRESDSRIIVTTDALSHFQEDGKRWISQVSPLFGLSTEQYDTVVIYPPWSTGGYRMKDICKEMGTAKLGEIRYGHSFYAQLDSGHYDHWLKEDPAGKTAMQESAEQLMDRHQIRRITPTIAVQPWYRKLLAHRNGASS
ncbi:hypothetical protein [Paenibacillus glycanilyticus]|uniref:AAA domain-containing protein n=1 Tax=Paenibacillus glycanilyticus TaxID=126569 RepID=A0ABQ6GAN7_9BACL|nr:hypothetical protein [Paenibacillus glycanilyticus]GLX66386.1 hypothetical protein MU1_07300 [Paenibacillus glycanilyticus]